MFKVQIILGSTRPGRFSEAVGKAVLEQASKRTDIEFELIDLKDYPLPFYEEAESVKTVDAPVAKAWSDKIKEADGFIFVTPEYNHGYPAVLKNHLDYLYKEWNNKVVAFVSYGAAAGGARSVEQLRQVVAELQMVDIREAIHIVNYWEKTDENGNLKEALNMEPILNQMFSWLEKVRATS